MTHDDMLSQLRHELVPCVGADDRLFPAVVAVADLGSEAAVPAAVRLGADGDLTVVKRLHDIGWLDQRLTFRRGVVTSLSAKRRGEHFSRVSA